MASESVTAGLRCAPEIGPNVRMRAISAAPVAMVLASRAIATFPPASRSPMMPGADDGGDQESRAKKSDVSRRGKR